MTTTHAPANVAAARVSLGARVRGGLSWSTFQPVLAVALGLALGLTAVAIAGENPLHVLVILGKSAFGSAYDLGMTLFYATPLIFTGLSVALAFQAGLLNIGAEGQLTLGALAAASFGALVPSLPAPLSWIGASFAAFAAGAAWGFIPGWLRARRGSHEVINTIMLNFVAAGVASYVTIYLLQSPDTQAPETRPLTAAYLLPRLPGVGEAPLSWAFPLALLCAGLVGVFLFRSVLGYEFRAVGLNDAAARESGIDPARTRILAMTVAGGLAGLVGVGEVLGNAGRFKLGFSPAYGFIGVAVALLGRARPLGVVASALLFGALHKGTGDLDLETDHITKDLSLVLQACIILCVAADGLWDWTRRTRARSIRP